MFVELQRSRRRKILTEISFSIGSRMNTGVANANPQTARRGSDECDSNFNRDNVLRCAFRKDTGRSR